MEWVKPIIDKQACKNLASRYNIDNLTAAILLRRGVETEEQIHYYLSTKEVLLHNPFLLTGMEDAVDRIVSAIEEHEICYIVGDRDVDGMMGSVLLAQYLLQHEVQLQVRLPKENELYGLQPYHIDEAKAEQATLLICIDNGASAYEALNYAYEKALDVVILDHHADDKEQKTTAYAYVNPHQDECYPNQFLSASAVVHKTIYALSFALSGFFKRPICFMQVELSRDKNFLEIDVLRSVNMAMGKVAHFTIGQDPHEKERFVHYIEGIPIYMYQSKPQCDLLEAFFGADVYVSDLAVLLEDELKQLTSLSLRELIEKSTVFRHQKDKHVLETLYTLFHTVYIKKIDNNFAYYDNNFDLAALGLIADIMPLKDENRILIKKGLMQLNRPNKDSIRLLINRLEIEVGSINYRTVSFKIAPLMNAAGRMGVAQRVIDFFLADETEQQPLLEKLYQSYEERKALSSLLTDKLQPAVYDSFKKHHQKAIFIENNEIPKGQLGLLASRFADQFKEALVIFMAKAETSDHYVGSMRAQNSGLIALFFKEFASLFHNYGGHAKAGGFSIIEENKEQLWRKFDEFLKKIGKEAAAKEAEVLTIDAEIPHNYFNEKEFSSFLTTLKQLAPYGEGFEVLKFVVYKTPIAKIKLIGKQSQHLKLTCLLADKPCDFLWWNQATNQQKLVEGEVVNIVFVVESQQSSWDYYFKVVDLKVECEQNV